MTPIDIESNTALAIVYAMSIYAGMLLLSAFLLKFDIFSSALTMRGSKYGTLDGLRGILATSVFVHHSIAMYVHFTQGVWQWTTSPVLNHFGQTSVALFFMITSFLFTNKAFESRVRWKSLYLSRIYRLTPLYVIVVLALLGVVLLASNGELKEPPLQLLKEFLLWVSFCCFGRPDINAYPKTWTIIAGVNWTLRLEILFYVVAVPLLHLISRFLSVRVVLMLSVACMAALLIYRVAWEPAGKFGLATLFVAHFAGGIIVALAFMYPQFKSIVESVTYRCVAAVAAIPLLYLLDGQSLIAVICTMVIFSAFVGGASLFGILEMKCAIWLGDVSYGIYLIHGLVLWLSLSFLRSQGDIRQFGLIPFWLTVCFVSSVVVILASLSYAKIEKPAMARLSLKRGNQQLRDVVEIKLVD